jgi:hypothetical protein
MKILRWILCFPAAIGLSILSYLLSLRVFNHDYFGGGIFRNIIGLLPVVIRTALPTVVLVLAGVWISPSKGRKVAFVFFTLGLMYSGGGLEMLFSYQFGHLNYWVTEATGIVLGALAGLLLALRLQGFRRGRANKSTLQTPANIPTAASAPVAPPSGIVGL